MSQTATRDEQISKLRDILVDALEIDPDELTETSHFINDHGADSMTAIDIVSGIELELGVQLPNEALPELTSLAAVYDLVQRYRGTADE